MFSVIFELLPHRENWDDYLDNAKMLRPELEQVEGFVDNIRYKSLTREGCILSLSNWRDEKSLVRWRTRMRHHEMRATAAVSDGPRACAAAAGLDRPDEGPAGAATSSVGPGLLRT
jgi:heme-degrading monooxygenase HmoA